MNKLNILLLSFFTFGFAIQAMEEPALLSAANEGDLEKVKELLAQGADIEIANEVGWTALMWASRQGYFEIVQLLLKNGANVHAKNKIGSTALLLASLQTDNVSIVECLVHAGADLACKNNDGETALMKAVYADNFPVTQYLIEQGADVNCVDGKGETALMKAAYTEEDDPAIVQCLMQAGARLNQKNKNGFPALILAADWGNRLCCEALIKGLLKIPNDKQKEKVILCTKAMMTASIPRDVRLCVKPYLCFVIKKENKEAFTESFAFEEINTIQNESVKTHLLSKYQCISALVESINSALLLYCARHLNV